MPRRLSLRDRFFTPRVARAVTSPSAILATGATAALGVIALSNPIGLLFGLVGYGVRVAFAIPRNPHDTSIDPFALGEPWRDFVADALQAQRRFEAGCRTLRPGPLHDRLGEIGDRLDTGVDEVWQIARRGQVLSDARKQLHTEETRRELAQLQAQNAPPPPGSPLALTAQSLQAQIATSDRMDALITNTRDRLRLLDARLDEMVTRTVELSTQADESADVAGLGADVDGLVTEMESLREALEQTDRAGKVATPTLPDPTQLPPPTASGQA